MMAASSLVKPMCFTSRIMRTAMVTSLCAVLRRRPGSMCLLTTICLEVPVYTCKGQRARRSIRRLATCVRVSAFLLFLSVYLCVSLRVSLRVSLLVSLFVSLCVYVSVCQSVCQSICLCV